MSTEIENATTTIIAASTATTTDPDLSKASKDANDDDGDEEDEEDNDSCFLTKPELGLGMKKDAKLELQKKLKKCEEADDTWTWLNDLSLEEYPLLMDLHKSTRKKWNSLTDWNKRPADSNSKPMMKRLNKRKMLKDCLFWLILYWANSANYNQWTSESILHKKAYKQLSCFVKNRREGKGGQGIKKLQQKFWERKYPNLFNV